MKLKLVIKIALVILILTSFAAPAFAQMTHTAAYEFDGTIDFEKQAGHLCNTGAEIKQTIAGNGVMDKTQTVSMNTGKISMDDENNWVAGVTPLTVTTVWELCAPPKYVFNDTYWGGRLVEGEAVNLAGWSPANLYRRNGFLNSDYSKSLVEGLTDQIWAVQVQADPGFSGNLSQSGVAAHGPYGGFIKSDSDDDEAPGDDEFVFDRDDDWAIVVGDDFVGSYFDMEQHARTSMGTLRRYIDISSPFNHSYLYENMSIVGKSDVQETFSLMNIKPGADMPGDWWIDLF
ncbi:MAG: hypothetical protein SCJ94_10480 [Bacillota bacterium]|nr:hypothetical protein [Bacillota bacterium]